MKRYKSFRNKLIRKTEVFFSLKQKLMGKELILKI